MTSTKHRATTAALLVATLIALAAPGAAAVSNAAPMASDWTWDGHVGFNWAARANHTHVTANALDATTTLDLDAITTPYVDIEILNLEPGRAFLVVDTVLGYTYPDGAYPNGRLVLWDIPAIPGTITLTDADDGSTVATIVLGQDSLTVPAAGGGTGSGQTQYPTRPCGSCGDTPRREYYTDSTTWVALNGAISTTSEATITVTSAWKHANQFHAGADFGAAAASIEYSRTYTWEEEASTTIRSAGLGQIGKLLVNVRTDYWSDGSKSVYMTGTARGSSSTGWGWQPPHCCNPFIIENAQTNGPQGFSLAEANSGAVTWTAAWSHSGLSGNAGTASTWDNRAAVDFSFHPPDDARHSYTWNVITGDRTTTGMVGWVYKDS